MRKEVTPQAPIDCSQNSYWSTIRKAISNEKAHERNERRKTLLESSANALRYEDIPFIPSVESIHPSEYSATGTTGGTAHLVVPDTETGSRGSIPSRYDIYPGNEVLIQGEFQDDPIVATGTVAEIDDLSIIVQLDDGEVSASKLQSRVKFADDVSIGVLLNPVTYKRRTRAASIIQSHRLGPALLGHESVTFSSKPKGITRKYDLKLYDNERQQQGIKQALHADQFACLQGPPGTGKTRVIIELVRRLVAADNRVLVAAETNAAVDNVLVGNSTMNNPEKGTLHDLNDRRKLRVDRTNPNGKDVHPVAADHYTGKQVNYADAVATTHSSAVHATEPDQKFDYVIIDEATQAQQSSVLIPLVRAKHAIFVGDHKQLPPYVADGAGDDGNIVRNWNVEIDLQQSFFELLYAEGGVFGPDLGTRFNIQYRMNPEIAGFPAQEWYDGDLCSAESAGVVSPQPSLDPIRIIDIERKSKGPAHEEPEHNEAEADAVEEQVHQLLSNEGLSPSEVGVAAAYRDQVNYLQRRLNGLDIDGATDVTVNTFDSFQGSERTAMVLSFGRSNEDGLIGFLGTDTGQRRLNVALTRAKCYCALVGDWDTLRNGASVYERLYKYVIDRSPPKESASS